MIYIVGSGPSAVASASALAKKGISFCVLDYGLGLEADKLTKLRDIQSRKDVSLTEDDRSFIQGDMVANSSGVTRKLVYGSSFPYSDSESIFKTHLDDIGCVPSLAAGGLSNVWGGAVLPYAPHDIKDWPVDLDELEAGYRGVLEFMPLTAKRDRLQQRFPLDGHVESLSPSGQALAVESDLEHHAHALEGKGVCFGRSRLAMHYRHPESGVECQQCGLCLYGCPYELVYNSNLTLESLEAQGACTIKRGVFVERFEESADGVAIHALVNGKEEVFQADKVLLAGGPLSSAKIVLESLGAFDQEIPIQDSHYFIVPFFRWKGALDVRNSPHHTLAQLFLEIDDPAVSEHTVHLQLYTYNDMYEQALKSAAGPFWKIISPIAGFFLNRLMIIQGYLHSEDSPGMLMTLRKEKGAACLHVRPDGEDGSGAIKRVLKKLWSLFRYTKCIPASPLLQAGTPGKGFHSGGWLPMRHKPEGFESDTLGRPCGMQHVHVVDSSVFPSIAATTITYTAMANAYRIASKI